MRSRTVRPSSVLLFTALAAVALAGAVASSEETPAKGDLIVISQKNKVFEPVELTVQKGESVVFRNDDPVTHNVFSRTEGSQFNLKMQKPGQEDVVTFDEPGDVTVRCAIHPTMKLTVHVE